MVVETAPPRPARIHPSSAVSAAGRAKRIDAKIAAEIAAHSHAHACHAGYGANAAGASASAKISGAAQPCAAIRWRCNIPSQPKPSARIKSGRPNRSGGPPTARPTAKPLSRHAQSPSTARTDRSPSASTTTSSAIAVIGRPRSPSPVILAALARWIAGPAAATLTRGSTIEAATDATTDAPAPRASSTRLSPSPASRSPLGVASAESRSCAASSRSPSAAARAPSSSRRPSGSRRGSSPLATKSGLSRRPRIPSAAASIDGAESRAASSASEPLGSR
jgi:hypothetical protein